MEFEQKMEAAFHNRVTLIGQLIKEACAYHKAVYGCVPENVCLDPEMVGRALAQIETDS